MAVQPEWRKSSYSGDPGGDCVEVASNLPGKVLVRDSKNPTGGVVAFSDEAFAAFVRGVAAGEF